MGMVYMEKSSWSLGLSVEDHGVAFESGCFRGLTVIPSPVFWLQLEDADGHSITLDSRSDWRSVRCVYDDAEIRLRLSEPSAYGDITVAVCGHPDETGISWNVDVINHSETHSVTAISYPTPSLQGNPLHLFIPDCCGRAIMDAGQNGFGGHYDYPGHNMSMQYFAWWGEQGGLYLGVHDPDACMKHFYVQAGEDQGHLQILFQGIGAGKPANSFTLAGYIRWEAITGDWYDATMLYASFVHQSANWLPEKGRPDTSKQFKEIPYWICDYIPNSKSQMEARPMTLSSVSERYGKDY